MRPIITPSGSSVPACVHQPREAPRTTWSKTNIFSHCIIIAKIILCLVWSLQLLLVLLYYVICSWSYPLWCCKWVTHLLDPAWGMPQLGCIRWVTQLHPPPQDWPIRAKHRPQLGSKGVSHQIHPVAGVEAKCPQINFQVCMKVGERR